MADEQLTEEEIENIKNEGDVIAGRVDADGRGVFAGSGAGDAQERRIARLDYRQDDFESDVVENYENRGGPIHGADVKTYAEHLAYLNYQDALGRERYPDWDENLRWAHRDVMAAVGDDESKKAELQRLLLRDDIGELAYEYGKKLKAQYQSQAPTQEEIEKMDGDQFRERLNEWTRTARSLRDENEERRAPLLTRRDLKVLNRLSPTDFAAALDILKARGE